MEILAVTVPIFMFVAAGYAGRKTGLVSAEIRTFLGKLVYWLAMPALIIRSILSFDFAGTFKIDMVAHNLLVTTIFCVLSFAAAFLIKDAHKRGAFNMSCFRSNQGYMGLPLANGFYGEQAMSRTAVINGFDSPLVIFLSVITLEIFRKGKGSAFVKLLAFVKNPLVLSAFGSLALSYFKVPLLDIKVLDEFLKTAGYMALPLALISVGASIHLSRIRKHLPLLLIAASVKLLLMPFAAYMLAVHVFGFTGETLGLSVILTATPTSVSSYIMAAEMDTDEEFIATAIGFTTFVSVITISLIKYILG